MRSVAFKARYLNYFAVARVPTNIGIPVSLSAIIKTNGRSKKRFIGFSAGPAEVHFTPITVTAAAFVPSLSTSICVLCNTRLMARGSSEIFEKSAADENALGIPIPERISVISVS